MDGDDDDDDDDDDDSDSRTTTDDARRTIGIMLAAIASAVSAVYGKSRCSSVAPHVGRCSTSASCSTSGSTMATISPPMTEPVTFQQR